MADFMSTLAGGVGSAVGGSFGSAAASGLTSLLNPSANPSGAKLGGQQRDYLDAAFPELNQWEQAGAGQQGASTASSAQNSQERLAKQKMAMEQQLTSSAVKKNNAEAELISARTSNERNATSSIGKNYKDVKAVASDIYSSIGGDKITKGVKSLVSGGLSPAKLFTEPKKNKRLSINMKTDDTSRQLYELKTQWYNAKTQRDKELIQERINELKSKKSK